MKFKVEERFLFKQTWEVKIVWQKSQDDRHLALFHDKEALDIFIEALESKGYQNVTNKRPF